jgi:Outer membrane protein beta-barrel family
MTLRATALLLLLVLALKAGAQDSSRLKELAKVTVTAQKAFIQLSANKITLNVAASPILAGGNAYDVLLRAPGVQEQQDQLSFRGRSVRILINGRPSPLTGDDLKTMLTNMAASGIERVEIIPSPPAKYEATGGSVINIVLVRNKAFGTNFVSTAGGGFGRYATANAGLDVNHRDKGVNVYGGLTYLHNEQYYSTWSDRLIPDGDLLSNEYDVRTRNNYGYKLGLDDEVSKRASFGFLLNGFVNERKRVVNNVSTLNYGQDRADSGSIVNTNGNARFHNPTVNVYYKLTLDSSGKELTFNADYLDYTKHWADSFANVYIDGKGLPYAATTYMRDESPANIHVYSWTADYVQPVKNGKWEAGARINRTITDNNEWWTDNNNDGAGWFTDTSKTNHFIYTEQINALYVSHFHSYRKWSVEAGLRAEQTLSTGNLVTTGDVFHRHLVNLFPNLSIGFNRKPGNQWSFTYRESIQRFGFDYINPFIIYQSQYAYSQGNPQLKPQINHQFSLSSSIGQSVWAGLEYQHSVNTLGASYRSAGDLTISTYDNFKGSDIVYAYVNYSHAILKNWQVNLYVSSGYFNYNLRTDSATAQQVNEKLFYALQAYNSFDLQHGWSAELNLAYTSALVTGIFQRQPYYYADAGISKLLWKGRLSLKASLKDIFNTQKVKMHTDYDGVDLRTNAKTESRFFNVTARYRFGNGNVRAKRQRDSKIGDINSRLN